MRFALLSLLVACEYNPPAAVDEPRGDSSVDSPVAGPCTELAKTCVGDTLVACTVLEQLPTEIPCGWGCSEITGAHCRAITPTGGAATAIDLDPGMLGTLGDVTLLANTILNSDTGTSDPAIEGFAFSETTAPAVGVFHFKSLHIVGPLKLEGLQGIALVADGPITIDGIVDTQSCTDTQTQGPGGIRGANKDAAAPAPGGGPRPTANGGGGGGGGHGADGGRGGGAGDIGGAGGLTFGEPEILLLIGGGAGAGGRAGGGGVGGGGGAAVQLVSNTSITINRTGGINAGGCGGGLGGNGGNDGAGGGGAGGTIVLEAPAVSVTGTLAVNGGGGGGSGDGTNGTNGTLDRVVAAGGTAGATGVIGGVGGAGASPSGARGVDAAKSSGGGGGIGWIRFNTRNGAATVDNTRLSPAIDDVTTCTQGTATIGS